MPLHILFGVRLRESSCSLRFKISSIPHIWARLRLELPGTILAFGDEVTPSIMTPERWKKIDQLFHAALQREGGQRAAFIAESCAGDKTLRSEIEGLIASHKQAESESFIETPASDVAAELLAEGRPGLVVGQTVGSYKIVELLGTGGMGEVYLAEDTRLSRKIALKLLPPHFTINADRVRRFDQEAHCCKGFDCMLGSVVA